MLTVVIYRSEYEKRDSSGWLDYTAPSRMDVDYNADIYQLLESVKGTISSFATDAFNISATSPDIKVLKNGVPVEDLCDEDLKYEGYNLLDLEKDLGELYIQRLRDLATAAAKKANDERLARERKEKSALEIKERDELARLMKKYAS